MRSSAVRRIREKSDEESLGVLREDAASRYEAAWTQAEGRLCEHTVKQGGTAKDNLSPLGG